MILDNYALNLIYVAVVLGVANIILLIGLLKNYYETYKEIKSGFTIGLLYFASFLLLQNIVGTLFITLPLIMPIEFSGSELHGPRMPLLFINLVQLPAFAILYKLTRE